MSAPVAERTRRLFPKQVHAGSSPAGRTSQGVATSAKAFRRLITLYLFDRPVGEFFIYIRADLIGSNSHDWLWEVLRQMIEDGEILAVDSGRPGEARKIYRLAAGAWLQLLQEEPECRIRECKKRHLLPR